MPYSYRSNRTSTMRRPSRSQSSRPQKNRGGKTEYIHPSRFIKAASATVEEPYVPTHTFGDFNLHEVLQRNLIVKGYETPSPIQDQAIPVGLRGEDIVGIANTGTGKTAAFALPILHRLMTDSASRALIVAPTRELAQQIEAECKTMAKDSGLFGAILIGGTSMGPQLRDLRSNPRIVIGTPGRIKDHLNRGTLDLSRFNLVVLDEVDRMLDMGFVKDMTEILEAMASDRQSFFFSATIDTRVRNLIANFTTNPQTVSLKASSTSDNVHQNVVRYQAPGEKINKLHDLLIRQDTTKVIVFDETQRSVERLSKELASRGFACDAIHGGKSQGQRQRALRSFKQNEINILVATDVAARGIDVTDITHVINYTTPKTYDEYIHRIGRTGRAGKIGHALTFVAGIH